MSNKEILTAVLIEWMRPVIPVLMGNKLNSIPALTAVENWVKKIGIAPASWSIAQDLAPLVQGAAYDIITPIVMPKLNSIPDEYIPQMDTDKTFTLIAGVSLAGTSLTPMIICPLKSLPKDFLSTEVWNGRDCVLGHSETGFANHSVFNTWYDEIFRPHLARNRFELCDEDAPALLICDGFRGHEDQEILAKAAEDNVMVVFIPAHSSHLTQALDKFAFANMKRHYQNNKELNESSLDRNGKKIRKMLSAYYSVLTPFTIRASWRAVGIETIRDEQGVVLSVSVNGQEVIARHAELGAQRSRRKRVPLDRDHLVNRAQLDRVRKGLCPRCGQVMPDHDEPVTPRRIRLAMGPQE